MKTCRGCGERDTIYISCDSPRSMFKSIPIKKRGEKKVSEMPCGLRDVAVCRCAKTLDEKWFGGDGCERHRPSTGRQACQYAARWLAGHEGRWLLAKGARWGACWLMVRGIEGSKVHGHMIKPVTYANADFKCVVCKDGFQKHPNFAYPIAFTCDGMRDDKVDKGAINRGLIDVRPWNSSVTKRVECSRHESTKAGPDCHTVAFNIKAVALGHGPANIAVQAKRLIEESKVKARELEPRAEGQKKLAAQRETRDLEHKKQQAEAERKAKVLRSLPFQASRGLSAAAAVHMVWRFRGSGCSW